MQTTFDKEYRFIIGPTSIDEIMMMMMTEKIEMAKEYAFESNNVIVYYDIEYCDATPEIEKNDPVNAISRAMHMINASTGTKLVRLRGWWDYNEPLQRD